MTDTSWTIERFDELDSTNDQLKSEARHGAPDRTVVVARRQTGGRGRGQKVWASPEGGLYCSALLRDVPRPLAPLLAFAAGEALLRTLKTLHVEVPAWLKWPNDLLIAPPGEDEPVGKAAGILVETVSSGERLAYAIIGLGVNLDIKEKDLPGDQEPPAVAFRTFQETIPDPDVFLEIWLTQLERVLTRYAVAPERLVHAVEQHLAWGGLPVAARLTTGGTVQGVLRGLSPHGGLRLDTGDGEQVLDAWDIERLDRAR